MTNGVRGVKKSLFNSSGVTAIAGSATFDYVSNNINYKVSFTNLLAQLGTTGSLVQVGDPLCTPVLDIQGTINGIRNIASGFGITAEIDASGCIEISTSFSFDTSGVLLVDSATSSTPTFASSDNKVTGVFVFIHCAKAHDSGFGPQASPAQSKFV